MPKRAERDLWVQLVAPWQRDAESLANALIGEGHRVKVYSNLTALAGDIGEATGVILLTQESLDSGFGDVQNALKVQPTWSDIPFVLLRSRPLPHESRSSPLPPTITNRIELERPLGAASLLSAVGTAMGSRQRQFEIKDRIDDLAASEKALAQSETELRRITDSLPVLIAFIDRGFRYRFANKAYQSWFGIDPVEMLGKTVEQVFGTQQWEARKGAICRAMEGEPMRVEMAWPRLDGKRRDAEIRYIPRRQDDGRIDGIHLFASDITERKEALETVSHAAVRLEQKVLERTAALEAEMHARSESEAALRQAQKMEAVGQLTGGIAHDFNNMLTSIIGALDILGIKVQDERTDRVVRAASESARRAAALTQRLLAFSRRQLLDPKPVEVNLLIQSMHMLLSKTLGERIQIEVALADHRERALVDINQLESAILNLCINARDAMPDGGRLSISTEYAQSLPVALVGDANAHGYVVVRVADNGVGMEPDVKERVFEPFFTTKPLGQGTGLGLSMIYGFVQQSKGFIDLRSSPGAGTAISLYLPATMYQEAESHAGPTRSVTPKGEGQLVLVVEDDDQVRLLVSVLLEELGYLVTTACNAMAALPLLTSNHPFDLLITDVGLPGMNGRQLAELFRQEFPATPVLFMTGYAEKAAVQSEFLGHNMAIITKPFALDDFGQAVRDALASIPS